MTPLDTIKTLYRLLAAGDVPAALDLFDAGIVWDEAEGSPYYTGKSWHGPAAVQQNLLNRIPEDWLDFAIHPLRFHAAGEAVVVEARYTGSSTRTGRPLDAQACHIWTVRGGKIAGFQQYADTARLRHAVGLVE